MQKPHAAVAIFFVLSMALAAPRLSEQLDNTISSWNRYGRLSPDERAEDAIGRPFGLADEVRSTVPQDECILVLAYSGPSMLNFYRQRLGYDLYPRRVYVAANWSAKRENCAYLAVFRDSAANLRGDPFQGRWNETELNRRLESMDLIASKHGMDIYRRR